MATLLRLSNGTLLVVAGSKRHAEQCDVHESRQGLQESRQGPFINFEYFARKPPSNLLVFTGTSDTWEKNLSMSPELFLIVFKKKQSPGLFLIHSPNKDEASSLA